MGVIKTDITESFFSAQQTALGKLSILIGMDSFCYCIWDASGRPVLLRRLHVEQAADAAPMDLPFIEQNHPFLFFPFSRVAIGLAMPRHVFVPGRLYDPESRLAYLMHSNTIDTSDAVRADWLPGQHAHLVYALPQHLDNWITRHFPKAAICHLSWAILQQLPPDWNSGKRVLAHIWENRLMVLFLENGRLVFENIFTCRDARDYLYYLLLTYEQFQLSPETISVALSGAVLADSDVYRLFKKYIRQIEFLDMGGNIPYGKRMSEHPPHFFNDLTAIVRTQP